VSTDPSPGPAAADGRLWRSEGVLLAGFLDGACAYDLLSDRVHLLRPAAARLLERLPLELDELVSTAHDVVGPDAVDPEDEVLGGVEALVALGVVGRTTTWSRPEPVGGSTQDPAGRRIGASHDLLDRVVAFRSSDPELLAAVDDFIGVSRSDAPPDVFFDADPRADGGIDLHAAETWEFPNRSGFFAQLPGVVHDFAARSDSSLVLHAGAVRTPDGRVVLLPAASEHGKSTLVAALVQAGCDYLGDEMIGVRAGSLAAISCPTPLALDDVSRSVLGLATPSSRHTDPRALRPDVRCLRGEVGPVSEIVVPAFALGTERSVELLAPVDALRALLTHATNLHRGGDAGFRALCDLAANVPVTRIVHGDSPALARSIIGGSSAIGASRSG